MTASGYRYIFSASVPAEDVEAALLLARFGAESLLGESEVALEAGYVLDMAARCCVIDATSEVGRVLNKLFVGFLAREVGPGGFRVERVTQASPVAV